MRIPHRLEMMLQRMIDVYFKYKPEPIPGQMQLNQCKIISHRGEHDNRAVLENTIPAFDRVKDKGIWGIEFDVRWTRDLKPVVYHDTDTGRLYDRKIHVNQTNFSELRSKFPLIPTLGEVIRKYGGVLHLMVEIKKEYFPDPKWQNQELKRLFSSLKPHEDYHLISLAPEVFDLFDFTPRSVVFPIAEVNIRHMSRLAIKKQYGGVLGHYLLANDSLLRIHHEKGQKIGTGYIGSKNCLFREINRNVEWIFSNNALEIQSILNSYLIV